MFLASAWVSAGAQTIAGSAPTVAPEVVDAVRAAQAVEALVLLDDAPEASQEATLLAAQDRRLADLSLADYEQQLQQRAQVLDAVKADLAQAWAAGGAEITRRFAHLPVVQVRLSSAQALAAVLAHPRVLSVSANGSYRALLPQSLPIIRQPAYAAGGTGGQGSTVAVLDTGVDHRHAAFGSCLSPGGTCKVIESRDFAPADGVPDDLSRHGTHVAATALGVAPGARLLAADVFGANGLAAESDIIAAIDWVIGLKARYNVVAINLSLGGSYASAPPPPDPFVTAVRKAIEAGMVVVAAAGDDQQIDRLPRPAIFSGVVAVSTAYDAALGSFSWVGCFDAVTRADTVPCRANRGRYVSLFAPGAVITAAGMNAYGSSYAAAHAAGAVALLRKAFPSESVGQIVRRLTTGPRIKDPYGPGLGTAGPRLDLVMAHQAVVSATLTVSRAGTGGGTVSSTPAGIQCGTDCSETLALDTAVTLRATPAAGSLFAGWSGACTGAAGCAVVMSAPRSVTATFNLQPAPPQLLTVTRVGTGRVTSQPAGVACGADCSQAYAAGTVVTLTAKPGAGWRLGGWTGACTGSTTTCTVTMSGARTVGVQFVR